MSRRRKVSDERILRMVRKCVLKHGPKVSTVTIAERLDVSQAVLFQRFGTKKDMVRAALELDEPPAWIRLAHDGPDARPAREQLNELGRAIQTFFHEMTPRFEMMRSCGILPALKDGEPMPLFALRTLTGWFERAAERGLISAADARPVAIAFLGALQARAWFEHIGRRPLGGTPGAYVETVVDLFHLALGAVPASPARPKKQKGAG